MNLYCTREKLVIIIEFTVMNAYYYMQVYIVIVIVIFIWWSPFIPSRNLD